jgi:magnesium-transporting ATPase (P-type)
LAALGARPEGLTSAEATARALRDGPNRLPQRDPPPLWRIMLWQFNNPLIYILAAAAAVSLGIGDHSDAGFIGLVLLINALIGGVQEWKADRGSRALQRMIKGRASTLRDGDVSDLDAEALVVGDIVSLESGARVPADMRLLNTYSLEVDESLLTGESLAVTKDDAWTGPPDVGVGDHRNMVYAGSIITRGRAQGVVVATGTRTRVGLLARDVNQATAGKPPLIVRSERFTKAIGLIVLVAASGVIGVGAFIQGKPLAAMFMFAVAMAVSAIPEGLPVSMTVALAVASKRMSRRGVIVRRLASVEALGSCTLIATDKTGTLTCNAMTVQRVALPSGRVLSVTGEGYAPAGAVEGIDDPTHPADADDARALARAVTLCNEAHLHHRDGAWAWGGDAVDIALLSLSHKLSLQREALLASHPEVNALPFESERQYAATFHRLSPDAPAVTAYVKGAPERVLAMCDLSPSALQAALAQAEALARDGFRVLAVAAGPAPADLTHADAPPSPTHLRWLGFTGMIDPLRPGTPEAIRLCRAAGVSVTMITGDHPITALAIARALGLATSDAEVCTGAALANATAADPLAIDPLIDTVRVFARVSPSQKLQITEAARRRGHFVAVTGDGVNDAPALRAANIGVAMGKDGTDVAREAADLVISDDNFSTIVNGIEEGRVAYSNISKVICLLVSNGAAELLMILITLLLGLPLPLLPAQLLWLNLVTSGVQDKALAFEPKEPGILRRSPRRPDEPIFDRLMIERILITAVTMSAIGVAAFSWMLHNGWTEPQARCGLLSLMVLFEIVHLGNCRSETASLFRRSPLRAPFLLIAAVVAFLVHLLALYLPLLQGALHTQPLTLTQWLTFGALATSIAFVNEAHKLLWRRRFPTPTAAAPA